MTDQLSRGAGSERLCALRPLDEPKLPSKHRRASRTVHPSYVYTPPMAIERWTLDLRPAQ